MTITVLDTNRTIGEILGATTDDRPKLVRQMLTPVEGMFRYFPGDIDLVAMHQMIGSFPLDRDEERTMAALETLRDADAWNRIERALNDALAVQVEATPDLVVPDITVLLMLGDPGDENFMNTSLGVVGNGSISGYIALTVWPFPENVERLEATAVHELNHNLRYSSGGVVWDPATVTVGEHVVSEGLADAFARQMYGDALGYTRIGASHLHNDEVLAKVTSGLSVTGMENFAAWVHGDAIASHFGATPVGLPTGAGYAAGNRLVDAYLAATGRTAAESLLVGRQEVIDTALETLPALH